jgi:hypothetical protein
LVAEAQEVARTHGWTPFVSMQNHLNLLYREEEREMLPLCADQGVGLIPHDAGAAALVREFAGAATADEVEVVIGAGRLDLAADPALPTHRGPTELAQVLAFEAHFTAARLDQAQHQAAQGGFATTRLTHHAQGFAGADVQVHTIDRAHRTAGTAPQALAHHKVFAQLAH